ncbi:hydroxypyruvate isomerase [Azovibrio restrictus]|uniref:hydroxypyruvate isomerase n=1 Tax=Azovibrio restrictus TaxID=146938 RepID=UPI0026EEC3F6|nr:hydroxypyruvate isomerase [Azovibrio restrictus]MDD3482882.1 hydroxypyruvate isomerase [Azovibrio restrictus]
MPRFCANLSFLFTELPFPERFAAAARAGFRGVEYLFPYDWPAADIAAWLREAGLEQVLFNLPAGDWAAGERGYACHPGREAEFRAGLELALDYAAVLGCTRLHALAGLRPEGIPEAELEATFLENMRGAADTCARQGVTLLMEPINSRVDMPGYWLDTPARAFALQALAGREELLVQLDLYHAQVMAGDLARSLEAQLARIGHIQVADNPGRQEPGTGEIHYPYLFALLDRLGYQGWVGCEYRPRAGTEAGLGWLRPWQAEA